MKEKSEDYKQAVYDVDNEKVLKYYKIKDIISIESTCNKCFIIRYNGNTFLMNEKCELLLSANDYIIKQNFIFIEKNNRVVTTNGQILPSEYTYNEGDDSDKYLVFEDDKKQLGVIDNNAKIIIEPSIFDKIDVIGDCITTKYNDEYTVYQDSNKIYQTKSKRVIANNIYIIDFIARDKANIIDIETNEIIRENMPFDKILIGEDFIIIDYKYERSFINKYNFGIKVNISNNKSDTNEIVTDGDTIINYYGQKYFINGCIKLLSKNKSNRNIYIVYYYNDYCKIVEKIYFADTNKIYNKFADIPLYS